MWKDIKGWEDFYEINKSGDVRNKQNKKLIIGDCNSIGYPRVGLYNKKHNPAHQRFFRHRLVAEHYIDNPDNQPEVNHKDHNIKNCNVDNLEWCTKLDNELDSHKYGSKKYKPFIVKYINGNIEQYDTAPQLARKINVSRRTIHNWLLKLSNGYKKYNIIEIEYI